MSSCMTMNRLMMEGNDSTRSERSISKFQVPCTIRLVLGHCICIPVLFQAVVSLVW